MSSLTAPPRDASQKPTNLLFFIVALLLVFLIAARTPLDTDLWWHLKAGEVMLTSGRPLLHDIFSYTRNGAAWVNHSWLSEVGLAMLNRAGGFLAIASAVAVIAAGSMSLAFVQMDGPAMLRAFIVILASLVASFVWSPRPQTVSLLLFAAVLYLLYLYKWRQKDYLWMLIPLFILWSNLHGGYALGLLAIGALIGGELFNHLLGYSGDEILPFRRIGRLALFGGLSWLAVIINPNGVQAWLIPFQTVGVKALQQYIYEWSSPDFHVFGQQSLLWMLFFSIAAFGASRRRLDGSDLALFGLFGYMAFVAKRNYGPFALAAAPVLSRHLWRAFCEARDRLQAGGGRFVAWGDRIKQLNRQNEMPVRFRKALNLTIIGVLFFGALLKLYAVANPQVVGAYIAQSYPAAAVDWIKDHRPLGRMLSSYNWGGYLIWSLPEYPVFLDGRTDLYNDEIIDQWLKVVTLGDGWQAVLDRWKVNLILIEPDQPVVRALPQAGWRELYRDPKAVVYGR